MHDLLKLLGPDDRARKRFVEWVKLFVAAIAAWSRKAAPMMRRFAQATERIENAAPVKGDASLLLADGYDPLLARFFAGAAVYTGQRLRERNWSTRRRRGISAL